MTEYKGILQNECDGCAPVNMDHMVLCPACNGMAQPATCGYCVGYSVIDTRKKG